MIRIFIADDHVLIREGFKKLLREEKDMGVVGEAQTAAEILDQIVQSECDILVLDLGLPDRPGLEVLREVKRMLPHLCVLILSMFPEDRFALRALKAGADGYLSKDSAANELARAIRRIASGKKYISENLSQDLLEKVRSEIPVMMHEALSDREFQILQMIASGKTISAIASQLNLSVSTVNTHRAHILEKMNMHTNAELMRYVIENKLV
ncbi:MAG TPA: DNA-binding response regulator [Bacteroidetes bacterium]|nr:MAG: DNA-binding response regulator [Ignavibacteria bacterium GWA2_54_16]HCA80891.1 DNA-binding response regulator [Bacteroidota bacterium]